MCSTQSNCLETLSGQLNTRELAWLSCSKNQAVCTRMNRASREVLLEQAKRTDTGAACCLFFPHSERVNPQNIPAAFPPPGITSRRPLSGQVTLCRSACFLFRGRRPQRRSPFPLALIGTPNCHFAGDTQREDRLPLAAPATQTFLHGHQKQNGFPVGS